MVFETYLPRYFCREYVEAKGNSMQLGMFMAVVLGIKPLMDDWIPQDKMDSFRKIFKQYGLKVRENIIFQQINKEDIPREILGKEYITTTSAKGYPLNFIPKPANRDHAHFTYVPAKQTTGVPLRREEVHVFISKEENLLKKGMWYPVVIKNRVIFQPKADSLKYGYVLGYPDCCIKFFRKFNNWLIYSHLYEAYANTKGKPSFLCNPFLKDTSFSYIYHMPCSYSCGQTISLARRLRVAIKKNEPDYVKITDRYSRMPFLVFYEKKYYCFEGVMEGNQIRYNKFYFPSPERSKNIYAEYLRNADTVKLEGKKLILTKKGKFIKELKPEYGSFAPEAPFLIQFS
jgi:hypothetical protein